MSSMPCPATLDNVTCPQCGKDLPVTETLRYQLLDTARKEVEAEVAAKLGNERAALEFRLRTSRARSSDG